MDRDLSTAMKESWESVRLGGALIILAALAAYRNSLSAPFVFDDQSWIRENQRIQHAPLTEVADSTSRPVVQLSLALNYAVGGLDVRGYHALNLIVHMLAALTLYGIVRRTLAGARLRSRYDQTAGRLAFAVALLWLLHPLQTESVTYIVQRAESMMGLFYLLTLYCVIRGAEVTRGRLWYAAAMIACAVGMGCKPVMVTAPVMVLLYDRVFLTGSFREALRRRVWLYSGLAATWLLLLVLLENGGQEWKTSAGFAYQPVQPVEYMLTQPGVILHYLRLSVWPHPLCLDYAWPIARTWISIVPPATLIAILLFATVWLWKSTPSVGFVSTWFFLTLAPSSSVVPIADAAFEHRMYLPLAAVVVVCVMGIHALVRRRSVAICLVLAVGLGFLTAQRNEDYHSELAIWSDTVAKRPSNPRALNNLGNVLLQLGKASEAIHQYERALRITPDDAEVHNNLWNALLQQGKVSQAICQYEQALWIKPDYAEAHYNLGNVLLDLGKVPEAIARYRETLRLVADFPLALYKLAWILATNGNANLRNAGEAVRLAERLCAVTGSQHAEDLDVLAAAYAEAGRFSNAIRVAQKAIELAGAAGQQELAQQVEERLKLYQAGRPFHEGPMPTAPAS